MDVRCQQCGTEYDFDENRIGPRGVTVKCTHCAHVFRVYRPNQRPISRATTTIGAGPQGKEWLVRKPDGQMIAFRELTTLQKWIVEGRIGRDDEISKNGETWKRLGNIMELESFFTVYEKAQTLNNLMDKDQQVQLRGTEVLGPLATESGSFPASSQTNPANVVQADPGTYPPSAPARPVSLYPGAQPNLVPSGAPSSGFHAPIPQDSLPQSPVVAGPMSSPAIPLTSPTGRGPIYNEPPTPVDGVSAVSVPASDESNVTIESSVTETGLAGPGALADTQAEFAPGQLDFQIKEEPRTQPESDPVEVFEQSQRRKRAMWVVAPLLFLGIGIGVALGLYGPQNNRLGEIAQQVGLREKPKTNDGADTLINAARKAADIDTRAGQTKALEFLDQAQRIRPADVTLLADRALATSFLAESLGLWAQDLIGWAESAEATLAAWEKKTTAWKSARRRKKGTPPPRPEVPDPKMLRADAERFQKERDQYLQKARVLVEDLERRAPAAYGTVRALAAYHLAASQDAELAKALDKALAMPNAKTKKDYQLRYIASAAQARKDGDEGRKKAQDGLTETLTFRPSYVRARYLRARLRFSGGHLNGALTDVRTARKSANKHEGAVPLEGRIVATQKAAAEPEPEPPEEPEPKTVKRDFRYWMSQGDRLRERDRTTQALNAYGRAAEINPRAAEVHVGKGWCFLDLDRPHPAQASFEKAVSVNDGYAEAHYGLAETYRALGQKQKAIKAYERYLSRAPPNSPDRRAAQFQLDRLKK